MNWLVNFFFSILFFLKAVVSLKQKEWKFDYWFISLAKASHLNKDTNRGTVCVCVCETEYTNLQIVMKRFIICHQEAVLDFFCEAVSAKYLLLSMEKQR